MTLYVLAIFTNETQATSVIDSLHRCTANLLCSGAHTCTFIQLGICYLQDHSQLYHTCILKHLQSKCDPPVQINECVVKKLLEIWVDGEWLKEQQHQIKYETILFLQWKTIYILQSSKIIRESEPHIDVISMQYAINFIQWGTSWNLQKPVPWFRSMN